MTRTPTISVVMPVYNAERFVQEAVDSILGQTYSDFEFVIVDDGSSDRTVEILSDYARRDKRVFVHRQPRNMGVTAALNQGIRFARGPLVARMDADDISARHRFERQVRFLEEHAEIAVVGSWVEVIGENGERMEIKRYPCEPALIAWSMLFYDSIVHPSVMMRRSILGDGPTYTDKYPRAEDYALFIGLSFDALLANIPEPLLFYRRWGGNVSRDAVQLDNSVRLIRDWLRRLSVETSEAIAAGLFQLSRGRYPRNVTEVRALATLIEELYTIYADRFDRRSTRSDPIAQDAAVRLWLLAALSMRRSPRLALAIAGAATRIHPLALFPFTAKVVRQLVQRLRMMARPTQ